MLVLFLQIFYINIDPKSIFYILIILHLENKKYNLFSNKLFYIKRVSQYKVYFLFDHIPILTKTARIKFKKWENVLKLLPTLKTFIPLVGPLLKKNLHLQITENFIRAEYLLILLSIVNFLSHFYRIHFFIFWKNRTHNFTR